jgi:hypothetical protein
MLRHEEERPRKAVRGGHVGRGEKDTDLADEFLVGETPCFVVGAEQDREDIGPLHPFGAATTDELHHLRLELRGEAKEFLVAGAKGVVRHEGTDAELVKHGDPVGDLLADFVGELRLLEAKQDRTGDLEQVACHLAIDVADLAHFPSGEHLLDKMLDRGAVGGNCLESEGLLHEAAVATVLLAIHGQEATRDAALARALGPADAEEARLIGGGVA